MVDGSTGVKAESIAAATADELYKKALRLACDGRPAKPRGMATREQLGVTLRLLDPKRNVITSPARRLNYAFSVAEWMWIMLGRTDVATVASYNKRIAEFSDDGVGFFGAYGPRIAGQLDHVVSSIKSDPDTRQAIMTIWRENPPKTRDVPCTVMFQFLLREGRLNMHAYMRSNDAWLGLPYDLFNFTQIQAYVAEALLGVEVGHYTHTVGSFHMYERDLEGIAKVMHEEVAPSPRSPRLVCMPIALGSIFERISVGDCAIPWKYEWAGSWAPYLRMLEYWTHRDPTRLLEPYRSLLTARFSVGEARAA